MRGRRRPGFGSVELLPVRLTSATQRAKVSESVLPGVGSDVIEPGELCARGASPAVLHLQKTATATTATMIAPATTSLAITSRPPPRLEDGYTALHTYFTSQVDSCGSPFK